MSENNNMDVSEYKHTSLYSLFVRDLFYRTSIIPALKAQYENTMRVIDKDMANIHDVDESIAGSYLYHLDRLKDDAAEAFQMMKISQVNQDYASLLNMLESYLIDLSKLILKTFPLDDSLRLKIEVDYRDLFPILTNAEETRDFILERIIEHSDRSFDKSVCFNIIKKYFSKNKLDYGPIESVERALRRGYEVRHKITHRGNQVDGKFTHDIKSLKESKSVLTDQRLESIGTLDSVKDGKYLISDGEVISLIYAINKYANYVDQQLCIAYKELGKIGEDAVDFDQYDYSIKLNALIG